MRRPTSTALWTTTLAIAAAFGCAAGETGGAGGSSGRGGSGGSSAGRGGSGGGGSNASGGSGGSSATGGSGTGTGGSGSGNGGSGSGTGGSGTGGSGAGGTGGSGAGTGGSGGAADGGVDMPVVPTTPIKGNGCAGGACLNPMCKALTTAAPVGDYVEIGFEQQPSYIPNDVVVLTFDDVPDPIHKPTDMPYANFGDGDWTRKLVDYIDMNNLHTDFFINSNNWCDFSKHPECNGTMIKLLKNHNAASHSVHHMHMGGSTPPNPMELWSSSCGGPTAMYKCDDEMKGVEELVSMLSAGGIPHLTRFRAPYGEPFLGGGGSIDLIRGIVKKYAVHIGWQIDSGDSNCDTCKYTGQAMANNVLMRLGQRSGQGGNWGVVLMHSTYPWTYDAAKTLMDPTTGELKKRGYRLGTVEDVICWKYGKHSWELVQQVSGQQRGPN